MKSGLLLLTSFIIVNFCLNLTKAQSIQIISSKIDSLLKDAESKQIFSGVVLISHDGKEFYYKQIGYADWQSKRPFTRYTLFNIGSLNKQFTEEIIHQLAKENKLKYDDKLNKYSDMYSDEIGNNITIQLLLDMSAGLGDYLMLPKFREISENDYTINELINIIKSEPLLFEPGKGKQYSNSGYVVLGAVIEKVTGKSYLENLRERIALPLGLKSIYYTKAEKEKQKDRAFGTILDFEGMKTSLDDYSNSTPAGGIYSNVDDLLRFAQAKLQSKIPSGKKYGRGSFAGGTPMWNSTISFNESNGYVSVIMANMGRIADELTPRIASIIRNESYPPLSLPFEMTFYRLINIKGMAYVKENIQELARQAQFPYGDRFLNYFGYQFLNSNKIDIAIKLFKLNTELFPDIANTFDSMGEAYMKKGDKGNAVSNYKNALKLDPNNSRIKNILSDLEKGE